MTESNDVGQHGVMDVDKVAQRDDVVTIGKTISSSEAKAIF